MLNKGDNSYISSCDDSVYVPEMGNTCIIKEEFYKFSFLNDLGIQIVFVLIYGSETKQYESLI